MKNIKKLFGFFMVLFYLGMGIFILFCDEGKVIFPPQVSVIFGIAILLYGGYRAYLWYYTYLKSK